MTFRYLTREWWKRTNKYHQQAEALTCDIYLGDVSVNTATLALREREEFPVGPLLQDATATFFRERESRLGDLRRIRAEHLPRQLKEWGDLQRMWNLCRVIRNSANSARTGLSGATVSFFVQLLLKPPRGILRSIFHQTGDVLTPPLLLIFVKTALQQYCV